MMFFIRSSSAEENEMKKVTSVLFVPKTLFKRDDFYKTLNEAFCYFNTYFTGQFQRDGHNKQS